MKKRSRSIIILVILFGYIILQFLWWEILLVKQNGLIIDEKQKLIELASTNPVQLAKDVADLHHKKMMQTVMIASEGTVFLLLLLFGIYKIRQAMEKEAQLNERQKNFFLSVTHELKTPIAATKLQLQTMHKQKLEEDVRQRLITQALQETERLNALIDNILLASRLESDELVLKFERQNMGTLVRSVTERYYKHLIESGELRFDIGADVFCEVDIHSFPSVIINLIDNAIKYSPTKKNIEISLSKQNEYAFIRVSDNGCGIPDEEKEHVFTKFYRAGNEETRKTKGTGLGLFIVNYLIQKHRGTIGIRNNKPMGSIFEIKLSVS